MATGKRRMRNGWRTAQPERYTRIVQPKQEYQLTEDEWRKLGGTERPIVDDETVRVPKARVPFHQLDCADIWQDVANRLGVLMVTITWRDPHERTIIAEPDMRRED